MIVEDTKDLVETDDYVIIEATLSEGDLLFVQIAVGIRNEVGDIVRIIPISTNPIYRNGRAVICPAISMPISAFLGVSVGSAVGVRAYIVRGTWVPCDGVLQIICKRTAKSIDGC